MKTGTKLSGTYSNGIETLNFSGVVESIHNDTAGGGFASARIALDKPVAFSWEKTGRQGLILTLDGRHENIDSRFVLN